MVGHFWSELLVSAVGLESRLTVVELKEWITSQGCTLKA